VRTYIAHTNLQRVVKIVTKESKQIIVNYYLHIHENVSVLFEGYKKNAKYFLIYYVYYFLAAEAVRWCVWYSVPVAIAEAVCARLCALCGVSYMVEPQRVPVWICAPDGVRLAVGLSDGVCGTLCR